MEYQSERYVVGFIDPSKHSKHTNRGSHDNLNIMSLKLHLSISFPALKIELYLLDQQSSDNLRTKKWVHQDRRSCCTHVVFFSWKKKPEQAAVPWQQRYLISGPGEMGMYLENLLNG